MNDRDKDRASFFAFLRNLLESGKVKVAEKLEEEMVIVCALAKDWDTNKDIFWSLDTNKSYPRNVVCSLCKELVVMSNGMYDKYIEGGRKQRVNCIECSNLLKPD